MAAKGIEVGGWRLEPELKRMEVILGETARAQVLGVLALFPRYEREDIQDLHDLVGSNSEIGSSMLVNLQTHFASQHGERRHKTSLNIRFHQVVRVGNSPYLLQSIFDEDNFILTEPIVLRGGRKLTRYPRANTPNAPTYKLQRDLMNDIEQLCPVTDQGIGNKVAQLHEILPDMEMAYFEKLAQEKMLAI